ncbi:sigma-54 dependent transcriptional regulator [Sporomusa sp. KB1]|uniref:sigma-54-dependent transcriptional regulator n=1 Tax=Sporomusa sp. KB1 TaxID=943346 RepID=UPI0011A0D4DC|nr:sigma-54 dependent transcriptional regulator [Sporomusa sp. KB1]TWH48359.1 DNA-binding NtrC family response regulator [Sporomusa sp. KB1]
MNILLVDDDQDSRGHIASFLNDLGHTVYECGDGVEALPVFQQNCFPMVLSDIKMPKMSGLELLKKIKAINPKADTSLVLFTGHGDMESAIDALRFGARDYLLKPINVEELAIITERIEQYYLLRHENERLTEHFEEEVKAATFETRVEIAQLRKLVAQSVGMEHIGIYSKTMEDIIRQAKKYHTNRTISVLIQGETGTGKEIIAKLIHFGEFEKTAPFVDINCAAITPSLFESEMFGHEGGSFTGSLRGGKPGIIEMAHGGTLFLDEISELPFELQGKLLRVIQEKEFYRVGGTRKIKTDVRIICATNTDLATCVQKGKFRQDLYFRLKVGTIIIPPLRERKDEILALASHFMKMASEQKKKQFSLIGKEAAQRLITYHWPGNIRELKNLIEWITFMYDDTEIRTEHLNLLQTQFLETIADNHNNLLDVNNYSLPEAPFDLDKYMRSIAHKAVEKFKGNKTKAAQYLGISRSSLACRLRDTSD